MYNIPYYISAILTIGFGYLVDKFGRRTEMLIVSSFLAIFCNLWFLLAPTDSISVNYLYPIIGQSVMGIYYSVYVAVLWACVPLCVKEKNVGTAFGVTSSF